MRATGLVVAFELGRRGAWAPPRRGERCLDPGAVYELMRPLARAPRGTVTLVYGARDEQHSGAVVMRDVIDADLRTHAR